MKVSMEFKIKSKFPLDINKENKSIFDPRFTNQLNDEYIYITDEVIKLKSIDDFDFTNRSFKFNVIPGDIYTANVTTSKHYYFVHETKTTLPSELFITLEKWREITINEILE